MQEATAELAEQNELLRRQHIALEQASALKSQFLANMSHEFRTPLNAILGYTHMLLNNVTGQVTDPQRKSLSRIDSNARHLLALINDILDITRIEAGPDAAERDDVPASASWFDEVHVRARADHQALEPRGLVEAARRDAVACARDRQKVKQIVLNLLSNALKFTPAGLGHHYCARTTRSRREVAIAVKDTGVGIPTDDQVKGVRGLPAARFARRPAATAAPVWACRSAAVSRRFSAAPSSSRATPGAGSTFRLRLPAKARRR